MTQKIANIVLLVNDYDEAIEFYTKSLGFTLIEDTVMSETKRWVIVSPPGATESRLLLAKAKNEAQKIRVGDQAGQRVFLFLHTDDFWRDYKKMTENKVRFVREPSEEVYGTVAVFEDLYGNLWDLVEPKEAGING
ncbi:VOC family protein [uncultured Microscilla sp.]|uniref:VOC family protein n=1 Tax=uncultured Microscilla sp. TaxID=432653 RepID=UPI002614C760|nr:VOC family protein [uncultured Microscilla sp.]